MATPEEQRFKERLADQLRFLKTSCERYDEGDEREAVRIAVTLRVLFHDTKTSTSLLTHLNAKDKVTLYSVSRPPPPGTLEYRGMGRTTLVITPKDYEVFRWVEPVLDDEAHPHTAMSVRDWWEMPVFVSSTDGRLRLMGTLAESTGKNVVISRNDIILGAANKDGGAHVDELLAPDYEFLAQIGAYRINEGEIELANGKVVQLPQVENIHLLHLRQMGYEVLHSPHIWALLDMKDQQGESAEERDTIAHYYGAYYRELRRVLEGRSFGVDTVPSHLMPWKRNVYVLETRDGHFIVNNISNPSTVHSDLYEDYIHIVPRRHYTLREHLKQEKARYKEGTQIFRRRMFGKRSLEEGFLEVMGEDYLEREDIITRNRACRLTQQEAREHAKMDLRRYLP
jgi:hypothetical protein